MDYLTRKSCAKQYGAVGMWLGGSRFPRLDDPTVWRRLRDSYADPAIELAQTKQALIVSAASVLDRLWNANGGGGWDESCEEDYVAPLRENLATDAIFSDDVRMMILQNLDEIVAIGRRNLQIDSEDEDAGFEPAGSQVDYIVQRTIEWCRRHPDEIPIAKEDEYHGHY